MICTKCKSEIVQGTNYCPNCGEKVTKTKKSRTKSRGNGTGTAFKRGSSWTAQVVVKYEDLPPFSPDNPENSRPRRKITRSKSGFKTRDAALQYCQILKAGAAKPEQAPTLAHYWDVYERGPFDALSESKQYAYRAAWKKLKDISQAHIDQLTVADLQRIVGEKCKTYYTARDCKVVLTALYRIAASEQYVSKDVPSFIQLPKMEETEREPFSETEQAALWKQYEKGDIRAAIPLLMIYTGMMPGEAMRLTVDNIDLDNRLITGVGMKTKVRKATPIVLADQIVPVVQDLIAHAQPSGKIWKGRSKEPFYKMYYDVLQEAGCRQLSPYSCRHTTATALAITENIAPQTVRKVMRWSNSRMLDRYAHPDNSDALAAVNSLKSAR